MRITLRKQALTRGGETWQRTMMGCTTRGRENPRNFPLEWIVFTSPSGQISLKSHPLASAGDPFLDECMNTRHPLPAFGRGTPNLPTRGSFELRGVIFKGAEPQDGFHDCGAFCHRGAISSARGTRESQVDMINDGLEAISKGGFLFANAPTGIEKTAASLSAALTVSRQNPGQHVLFMTGRQSQHKIVVETVRNINARLSEDESPVTLVDMIGRESMCEYVDRATGKCSCEQGIPDSERHNRRFALVQEILSHPQHVDFSIEFASKRRICAWAAARQAATDADILVCDYNHVFLESVRKASLPSMGIELENSIIIVDEAHNLPNRIDEV